MIMIIIVEMRIMEMIIMAMMANGGVPGKASIGGGGGKDLHHCL